MGLVSGLACVNPLPWTSSRAEWKLVMGTSTTRPIPGKVLRKVCVIEVPWAYLYLYHYWQKAKRQAEQPSLQQQQQKQGKVPLCVENISVCG